MICPNCKHNNNSGANHCQFCGAPLPVTNAAQPAAGYINWGYPDLNKKLMNFFADYHNKERKVGYAECTGSLCVYPDRLEYHKHMDRKLGLWTPVAGVIQKDSRRYVFRYVDIESCDTRSYLGAYSALVLRLKSGASVMFVGANPNGVGVNEAQNIVAKQLLRCRQQTAGQGIYRPADNRPKPPAPVINKNPLPPPMPAPVPGSAPQTAPPAEYAKYAAVFEIEQVIEVSEVGTVIVGPTIKGMIPRGAYVTIIGKNNEGKGTFQVQDIAVPGGQVEQTKAGDTDAALIVACPAKFLQTGDKAVLTAT